jgi:hypothetical protein
MDEAAGRRWLAAGFRANRKSMLRARCALVLRPGVDDETKRRGVACYDAIIAEMDTQIRDLQFTAARGEKAGE